MDTPNVMDVCRLCLDKDRVTIPIFEGEGVDREICLKIGSCLPVKVSSDDPLPKNICDDCTQKVELVYSFWNTTANAEKQLLEWLGLNEPHHGTPMDILKTEMVILKDGNSSGLSQMDLMDESQDLLDQSGDTAEGSGEESGREEDSGGGGYQYEDTSIDPSSQDVSHSNLPVITPEPGPSGVQPPTEPEPTTQVSPLKEEPKHTAIPQPDAPLELPSNGPAVGAVRSTGSKATLQGEVFKCSECEKEFSTHSKMVQHIKVHKERNYECAVCSKKFLTEHHLKMHGAVHEEIRPHTCDRCGCSFRYLKTLETHRKIHANEEEDRRFLCLVCNMRFGTRNAYNHHTKSHKSSGSCSNSTLNCRFCKKAFSSRQSLDSHMRVHTGNNGFSCDICGKVLTSQESLLCHQLMHSGEKQFSCQICGRSFAHRKYYVVHQRIHTGERPYKCDICDKYFTQSSTLTVHRRYHTGERPYQCSVCSKGFVTKTLMLSHFKKHQESRQML